ncbi:hypothetical protein PDJAM_G00084390 [Pangasius djambal]|uniref:Uncharacterized protein n=1 Tax=Pangasius djambal TaxID=1691987 RepID=A0ACC5Z438_9TELE|nr:hypothetical protein [Pangasius djambal]
MAVSILATLIMDACMPCHRQPSSAWCNLAICLWFEQLIFSALIHEGLEPPSTNIVLFSFFLHRLFEFKTWCKKRQRCSYRNITSSGHAMPKCSF